MRKIIIRLFVVAFTFAFGATTALFYFEYSSSETQKSELISSSPLNNEINDENLLALTKANLPIIDYCELANNPDKYDGKIVRVNAKLWFMMHGYSFFSKNCDGEKKQAAVIFPDDKQSLEIENKIAKDTGLSEYNPWGFPQIIAIGKFSRVKPSSKSDSMEDNTYLHFEILEVEKAFKQ